MVGKEYLGWYSKSPLGIGSMAGGLVLGIGLASVGLPAIVPLASGLGLVLICGLLGLFSGIGPRQVVSARDSGLEAEGRRRLSEAVAARERLARLRIADPEVAAAASLVTLAAGLYIEACRRESRDDPIADAAVAEALDILDIYFKEVDEASVEKRYKVKDDDPFADAKGRTLVALGEKAMALRERRIQIDGGLTSVERMEIREDLK